MQGAKDAKKSVGDFLGDFFGRLKGTTLNSTISPGVGNSPGVKSGGVNSAKKAKDAFERRPGMRER